MANKYIRHGVAFNGDGTTSDVAASDGAPGAWNTLNYLTGTSPAFGTLSNGDIVYIKTTDASDANITISIASTTNFGKTGSTEGSPVTWVFDDGTIWTGGGGQIIYDTNATTKKFTTISYNNFIAVNGNFKLTTSFTGFTTDVISTGITDMTGVHIDMTSITDTNGSMIKLNSGTYRDIYIKNSRRYQRLIYPGLSSTDITLINMNIELTNSAETSSIFSMENNFSSNFTVIGGQVYGAGVADGIPIVKTGGNCGAIKLIGFKYPYNMPLSNAASFASRVFAVATGADGFVGDAYIDYYYSLDSRDDGNYPTLNATLEDSANTLWSYKMYPYRVNSWKASKLIVSKSYILSAATKTITLEFLWPQGFASPPTSDEIYMDLMYTRDSDGERITKTSRQNPGSTLSTSSATWSATTYGATSFTKYKIDITTDSDIRQDTELLVTFYCSKISSSSADVLFVCPDILVS